MSDEYARAMRPSLRAASRPRSSNYADDCVFEDFPEMPDRSVYQGKDGMREAVGHFSEVGAGGAGVDR